MNYILNKKKDRTNFEDQFIAVQGWMVEALNLSGNMKDCFALIYGYSQDGVSEYKGGISLIAKWLNCSKSTAKNVVTLLELSGLINRNYETIKKVDYIRLSVKLHVVSKIREDYRGGLEFTPVKKIQRGGVNFNGGGVNSSPEGGNNYPRGGVNSTSNNISYNIKGSIVGNINSEKANSSELTVDAIKFTFEDFKKRFLSLPESEREHQFTLNSFIDDLNNDDYSNSQKLEVIQIINFLRKEICEKEKNSAKKEKSNFQKKLDLKLARQKKAEAVKKAKQQAGIKAIELLNELTGRKISTALTGRGSGNVDAVLKVYKKGYNFEEVELMIQYKCWEWGDNPKTKIWLRPSTLFGNKSTRYIEEAIEAKNNPAFQKMLKDAKNLENGNSKTQQLVSEETARRVMADLMQDNQ